LQVRQLDPGREQDPSTGRAAGDDVLLQHATGPDDRPALPHEPMGRHQ